MHWTALRSTGFALLVALLAATLRAQPAVRVAPLADIALYPERFAPATVISLNQPEISARISAVVESIPVQVGQRVERGELLVRLDCSDYQLASAAADAALKAAAARQALARSQLDRFQALVGNQLVSVQELDQRRTELEAAEADWLVASAQRDRAVLDRQRCEVRAPFDGLVLGRIASVGQFAGVGTPLVSLLDLDEIEVSAQLFSDDANYIDAALRFEFSNDRQRFPVELHTLVGAIGAASRNREARFRFVDATPLPGSAGKLYWEDPRPHLPARLLVERDGQLGFFIAERSRARFIELPDAQPGRSNPVTLDRSTRVVVDGFAGLSDGDELAIAGE